MILYLDIGDLDDLARVRRVSNIEYARPPLVNPGKQHTENFILYMPPSLPLQKVLKNDMNSKTLKG